VQRLDDLQASAAHFSETAEDVASLLLVEAGEGVDADWWETTISFQRDLREPTWTQKGKSVV
jgi:hypothetical protein